MSQPKPLSYGHWVKTADGSIGRVCDLWRDQAEIQLDGDPDRKVLLPRSELRRITDPHNRRPPIEGLPPIAERPRCAFCNKPLVPSVESIYDRTTSRTKLVRRVFEGTYHVRSTHFCTHRCAGDFARAAHKAGYRIVRKEQP
jgi:hypothetical protein